jgi:hypothetical protein
LKKIAAILFLFVVLFNTYGYRPLIDYLQNREDAALISQLDKKDYSDEELVTLKVPVNLPYYTNSQHYERVDGSVNIEGKEFNYVKRRIYNDSIEYACIPNQARQTLNSARDEFMKLCTDWQNAKQNKKPAPVVKIISFDYCEDLASFSFSPFASVSTLKMESKSQSLPSIYLTTPEQPPNESMQSC